MKRHIEAASTALMGVMGVMLFAVISAAAPASMTAVTPEGVRALFDTNAMLIMFVWGILHTRLPALAAIPNTLVPWVNCIGYILVKLMVPGPAHAADVVLAAGFSFPLFGLAGAFTSAATSVLYDKFVKSWLDKWLPVQPLAKARVR